MITQLLDHNAYVKRRIESRRRVKCLFEENIHINRPTLYRIRGLPEWGERLIRVGQITQQLFYLPKGCHLILNDKICHAGLAVHHRPTELVGRNILTQNTLNNARAGQSEKGLLRLNQKTTLPRQVAAASRIETKHAHDTGYDAADFTQRGKGICVTIKAANTRWNIGPCRII